jgi:hypothetical protein
MAFCDEFIMSITPPTIIPGSFIRNGVTGTIDVTAVDPGCTALIYGVETLIQGLGQFTLIGSGAGDGLTGGGVANYPTPMGPPPWADCTLTDIGVDFEAAGISPGDSLAFVASDVGMIEGIYTVKEVLGPTQISVNEIWAIDPGATVNVVYIFGSGTFTIDLDLSPFCTPVDGGNAILPFSPVTQAIDTNGNYSAIALIPGTGMLNNGSTPFSATGIRRDGGNIYFTPTGMPDGPNSYLVIWTPAEGGGYTIVSGEGEINVSSYAPFDPDVEYSLGFVATDATGTVHICPGGATARARLTVPGTPVSERIMNAIEIILQSITESNGYINTINQVTRLKNPAQVTLTSWPGIVFYAPEETYDDNPQGFTVTRLSVAVEAEIKQYTDAETAAHNLKADVMTAMLADRTLGGLSENVSMRSFVYGAAKGTSPIVAVMTTFEIEFKIPTGSPCMLYSEITV